MHRFQHQSLPNVSRARNVSRLGRGARNLACSVLLVLVAACGTTAVEPGYYRVKSGDTLSKIASQHGQSVASLTRWNKLSDANEIHVGQVLRVSSSPGSGTEVVSTGPEPAAPIASPQSRVKPAANVADKAPAERISLIWPANGKLTRSFNGSSSKGLAISNAAGTPVIAAAPGTVAYAGDGLRGYGNLVIVQHGPSFLTIYAHNRTLAVREGQQVKQGQKIAEMGSSDSNQVELYFELRYKGTATNPARLLPPR